MSQFRAKSGSSTRLDPVCAIDELQQAIHQPDIGLVILFVSSHYDLNRLAEAINQTFEGIAVIGCTTAGEIGPGGYLDNSISAVSIHRDDLTFEYGVIQNLADLDPAAGRSLARQLKEAVQRRTPPSTAANAFAFMLVDGLSRCEEALAQAFAEGLQDTPLIGGSAGDDLAFRKTWIFADGTFITDAALLLVATTPFRLEAFKTQHFTSGESRLVVTKAVAKERRVIEINGRPAATEYANAIGRKVSALGPDVFAAHPCVVTMGDTEFVRSIQTANADGSLTFFCAIDEGIVFKIAHGANMVDNLREAIDEVAGRIGSPALILSCDCILRQLEAELISARGLIGRLLADNNSVGFSTYGEQFGGMHINQTFTAVAIAKFDAPSQQDAGAEKGDGSS